LFLLRLEETEKKEKAYRPQRKQTTKEAKTGP